MFGAGMYLGQGANNNDLNDNYHSVARFHIHGKQNQVRFLRQVFRVIKVSL